MLEIRPLSPQSFPDFILLLQERGECPVDFYRWKYIEAPVSPAPTGFILYENQKPVGCIGVVNRAFSSTNVKNATWFADWFVSADGRGKGVGQRLMKEVRSQATINLGIAGPTVARKVCESAGYSSSDVFFEYTTYLKPFRCGYRRFAGGLLRRIARGILSSIKNPITNSNSNRQPTSSIINVAVIPVELWSSYASKSNMSLQRDVTFLTWIQRMPADPKNKREWWYVDSPHYFGCGFTETDFWGLRKAKILDLIVKDRQILFEDVLQMLLSVLKKQGYDWVNYCFADLADRKFIHYKTCLPLFVAIENQLESGLYLSALDKESSWREFLLK